MLKATLTLLFAAAALSACQQTESPSGDPVAMPTQMATTVATTPASDASEVAAAPSSPAGGEQFIAIGTEPFWNARVSGGKVTYTTPEDQAGQTFGVVTTATGSVREFKGTLAGQPFVLKLRKETCSDGMSDRSYSYAVALTVGGEDRIGCAEPGTAFKPE